MAKTPPSTPKLFGALGPDDSYFDARTKVAAKEAQQRWPLFKAVAPQSGDATPTLSPNEKARWGAVDVVPQETPKPVLSRPGLSSKLAKGLGKIARQTSAEVLGSTERVRPRVEAPVAFVPPLVAAPAPVAAPSPAIVHVREKEEEKALELAPEVPKAKRNIPKEEVATPPVTPSEVVPSERSKRVHATTKSAPAMDDSLSSIFQRVEGVVKQPPRPVPARKAAMKRLGKR
jgi:hypothetical protein